MAPGGRFCSWLAWSCLALLCLLCSLAYAQETSQICLSAFADADDDGQRAADEAPITQGIAASLLDESGITIDTGLLSESPLAADGLLCFDDLPAGRYRLFVSSSQYAFSSPSATDLQLEPGLPPPRLDFAAKPLAAAEPPAALSLSSLDAEAAGLLIALGAAALLIILVMALLGCLLVMSVMRRPGSPPSPMMTGSGRLA